MAGALRWTRLPSGDVLSQRSVLNIGFVSGAGKEYRFINHFQIAEQFGLAGGWSTGPTWMQSIGSNGWPNSSIAVSAGKTWGGGVSIPSSWQYGAVGSGHYYVFKFQGSGRFKFSENAGSWTLVAGPVTGPAGSRSTTNVTAINSDTWETTTGTVDSYMLFQYTGPAQLFSLIFFANDPDGVGATGNVRNVQFYRLDDETDLLAGNIFRTPYKQSVVDYCPSAIRFMDWIGGNNSRPTRFDTTRTLPNYAAWGGGNAGSNWVASPPYGETTGTNQYALASATGMPLALTQGEIVTCRIGAGMVRAGAKTVTAITKANPGVVTSTAHGFSTGDVIVHQISAGMTQLDLRPCTITVTDADHYSVGINTTAFSTFTAGTATQFTTLDVGLRGAYPIVFPSVTTFASQFDNAYVVAGDYKTFIFDKSVAMQKDSSGNYVYGVWIFNDGGANNGHNGGVPLEICVALVNEVNAMSPAHTIGMWMNIPHMAISSMDADHTTAANWGVQATNVVLNGANGFAGLAAPAKLFIEYSNETWNGPNNTFSATLYCGYRGSLRWAGDGSQSGDKVSMTALRSAVAMNDIAVSAYYNSARVKFVLSGQGTTGAEVGNLNQLRIDGSSNVLTDASNPGGAPMTHHDYFAIAGYFNPNDGGSYDFSALVSSWVSHIGNPTAQEADCATYVAAMVNTNATVTGAGGETMWRYGKVIIPALAAKLSASSTYGANKAAIMYEGGWNTFISPFHTDLGNFTIGTLDGSTKVITGVDAGFVSSLVAGYPVYGYGIQDDTTVVSATGTSITLSKATTVALTWGQFMVFTPENAFLRACKRSQAWATAMLDFFGDFNIANAGMPSDYVAADLTFGVLYPSSYGFKNTEWTDTSPAWQQFGTRNQGLN